MNFLKFQTILNPIGPPKAQSIIPINNYEEANIAIAFMNQNKEAMKTSLIV